VSKLYCARKRGYAELPLASREWFIKKLKEDHTFIFKPKVPEYLIKKQRAIAYLDYKWLARRLEGAPDEDSLEYLFQAPRTYPTRIYYKPHWFNASLEDLSEQDFFIWSFLEACAHENLPISQEAACWRDYVGVQDNWLRQNEILEKFKRPDEFPRYSAAVEKEIKQLTENKYHLTINEVEFEYPVELELINKKVLDYRPIPSHANGKQFPKPFIKWYLEKRVNEWLAAGGYVEWKTNFQFFVRFSEHPFAGGRLFLKAFYWDLWGDLAHVRLEYQRATGAALLIGKWWKYARFPFRLVTKPPALKKYYYQTLDD
jgi:hypothetical protein